jgi:hypothetical protein
MKKTSGKLCKCGNPLTTLNVGQGRAWFCSACRRYELRPARWPGLASPTVGDSRRQGGGHG